MGKQITTFSQPLFLRQTRSVNTCKSIHPCTCPLKQTITHTKKTWWVWCNYFSFLMGLILSEKLELVCYLKLSENDLHMHCWMSRHEMTKPGYVTGIFDSDQFTCVQWTSCKGIFMAQCFITNNHNSYIVKHIKCKVAIIFFSLFYVLFWVLANANMFNLAVC